MIDVDKLVDSIAERNAWLTELSDLDYEGWDACEYDDCYAYEEEFSEGNDGGTSLVDLQTH